MHVAPRVVIGVLTVLAFAATFALGRAGAEPQSGQFGIAPKEFAVSTESQSMVRFGRADPFPSHLRPRARAKKSSAGALTQAPKRSSSAAGGSSGDASGGGGTATGAGPSSAGGTASGNGTTSGGSTGGGGGAGGTGGGGGGGSNSAPSGSTIYEE